MCWLVLFVMCYSVFAILKLLAVCVVSWSLLSGAVCCVLVVNDLSWCVVVAGCRCLLLVVGCWVVVCDVLCVVCSL